MHPQLEKVAGQQCWRARTGDVELTVTRLGAQMAPVTFYRQTSRPIQPYYISPWQEEGHKDFPAPVLAPLRGDFFCAPFGGNAEAYGGENHPPHGEPAGSAWDCEGLEQDEDLCSLTLSLKTKVRAGKITRCFQMVEGHQAIYTRTTLEGFSGSLPVGHHAILSVPEPEGSVRVATSPIRFGMTNPGLFGNPAQREYQSLAIGARFRDLRRVPLLWKNPSHADCTRFPARTGYTDLLGLVSKPSNGPAWTTATVQSGGYLWYALKDLNLLPLTLFWIANRGRHGFPWNGRNRCLGLEDVRAFFADGLAASARPNVLSRQGIPTALKLSPRKPSSIHYIQGVIRIPSGFEAVESAEFAPGTVTFRSVTGRKVTAPVHHDFLFTGSLK